MSFTKEMIAEIIDEDGADNLTAKGVRTKLEAKLGVEAGALKSKKEDISKMIDDVLAEVTGACATADPPCPACAPDVPRAFAASQREGDEEEEEEEEEEQPKKKAKKEPKAKAATEENPNKGKMTCKTRSGQEAPKVIAALARALCPSTDCRMSHSARAF